MKQLLSKEKIVHNLHWVIIVVILEVFLVYYLICIVEFLFCFIGIW